jgi:uncharacterized protein involved in exopolysaccharide biosynthesis
VVPELEQRSAHARRRDQRVRIFYDNYDPIVARDVAQRLANDFIETHINARVQTSQKSLEFIEGELDRLSKRVREVETEIAQVKADNSGTLPEELDANQRRLERVLSELSSAQRSYDEATSDKQFFESQLATAKAMGGATTTQPGAPARAPQARALRVARARLHRQAPGRDPRARGDRAARAEGEERQGRRRRDAQPDGAAGLGTGAPCRAAHHRFPAEIERFSQLAESSRPSSTRRRRWAKQLDALKVEYEHLFNTYQDFAKRHNEATVQAQLERRQLGEQFRVLEQAFKAPEPSAPNRALILILARYSR